MIEFELKFQVSAEQRSGVRAFVAGRKPGGCRETRLQAIYFDTPDRLLAREKMALRLRLEGDVWVQTLKGVAADGLGREEYNLPLDGNALDGQTPEVDRARHAGVPLGDRLISLLKKYPADALRCSYRSDVKRLSRPLKSRHGTVELAFDEGQLQADGRLLPVCELEIELLDGHPLAVVDVARRWALRHGLWLDSRSKAERGDMLARGVNMAAPRTSIAVSLNKHQSACHALQASISTCRQTIIANAAQIASGLFLAEHVHQLRVALRRLRGDLQLFSCDPAAAALGRPLAEPAALLFRALGAARDQAVLDQQMVGRIETAMHQAGVQWAIPEIGNDALLESPTKLLRSTSSQQLLLDLIESTLPPAFDAPSNTPSADDLPSGKQPSLRRQVTRRLGAWHHSIVRDAAGFEALDEAARHRLRKHVKRLRYAIETASGLFDKKRLSRALKQLERAQQCLGDLNDVSIALRAFKSGGAADPGSCFAVGWLIAYRQTLLLGTFAAMKQLASYKSPWKR